MIYALWSNWPIVTSISPNIITPELNVAVSHSMYDDLKYLYFRTVKVNVIK